MPAITSDCRCKFVVLNLFLAILLDGFSGLEDESSLSVLQPEPSFTFVEGSASSGVGNKVRAAWRFESEVSQYDYCRSTESD